MAAYLEVLFVNSLKIGLINRKKQGKITLYREFYLLKRVSIYENENKTRIAT